MEIIDSRKLNGYIFLIEMGRITIEQVPIDYRNAINFPK